MYFKSQSIQIFKLCLTKAEGGQNQAVSDRTFKILFGDRSLSDWPIVQSESKEPSGIAIIGVLSFPSI